MKAVPKKLMNYGPRIDGASSITQIEPIMTKIRPMNASQDSTYSYNGTNPIYFKIPAYQNTFLDTARSYVSFTVTNTTEDASGNVLTVLTNSTPYCRLDNTGTQGLFARVIIKSASTGTVLTDISDAHRLGKIFTLLDTTSPEALVDQGDYSGSQLSPEDTDLAVSTHQLAGTTIKYQFSYGVLAKDLDSFLPLHLMASGGAFALDVELVLNDPTDCLRESDFSSVTSNTSIPDYKISNVEFNLALLKQDQSMAGKLNNIANSGDAVVIPYTMFNRHRCSILGIKKR